MCAKCMAFIAPGRLAASGKYGRRPMASMHATGFVVLAGNSCPDLAAAVARCVSHDTSLLSNSPSAEPYTCAF